MLAKGSVVGVPSGNDSQHDRADKDDTDMRDQSIKEANLEFPSKFQDRIYHLEEGIYPSAFHRGLRSLLLKRDRSVERIANH